MKARYLSLIIVVALLGAALYAYSYHMGQEIQNPRHTERVTENIPFLESRDSSVVPPESSEDGKRRIVSVGAPDKSRHIEKECRSYIMTGNTKTCLPKYTDVSNDGDQESEDILSEEKYFDEELISSDHAEEYEIPPESIDLRDMFFPPEDARDVDVFDLAE